MPPTGTSEERGLDRAHVVGCGRSAPPSSSTRCRFRPCGRRSVGEVACSAEEAVEQLQGYDSFLFFFLVCTDATEMHSWAHLNLCSF